MKTTTIVSAAILVLSSLANGASAQGLQEEGCYIQSRFMNCTEMYGPEGVEVCDPVPDCHGEEITIYDDPGPFIWLAALPTEVPHLAEYVDRIVCKRTRRCRITWSEEADYHCVPEKINNDSTQLVGYLNWDFECPAPVVEEPPF